jgi:hypothetical protein
MKKNTLLIRSRISTFFTLKHHKSITFTGNMQMFSIIFFGKIFISEHGIFP